jgi:hypothetical protein
MHFSAEDRGEMMSMVYHWQADQVPVDACPVQFEINIIVGPVHLSQVDMIVVTMEAGYWA